MTHRTTLLAAAALALPTVAQAQSSALSPQHSTKPNVILLLADDLGYNDISLDGRKEWQTPTLDHLASQGTTFRRWYTAAVVCGPSRAALMTGRYSIHNGVTGNASLDLPAEEVTIAAAMKKQGYATALFGKWHAGAARPPHDKFINPLDRGFDEFFGFTSATAAWQKFPKQLWTGREQKPSTGYADDLFADHTVDFIHRHKDTGPFFIYTPFIATHGLVEAPKDEIALHEKTFENRGKMAKGDATYAAEATRLDKDVARILKALDDDHLADNTIVIFTSDHGATFEKLSEFVPIDLDSNYPFRGQKRTLWEGGMHTPGIVRWPGHVPAGTESTDIVHNCDVFPTLLAAAGAAPDPAWKVDGMNLLDVWEGKSHTPARDLFWEWDEGGAVFHAAMRGNLKMVISATNKPELYDVVADPAERLDRSAEYPKVTKELKDGLEKWLATTSDAAKLKNKKAEAAARKRAESAGHNVNDE